MKPRGYIGPHTFSTNVEIQHDGEDPVEVEIEVDCVLHCDDPEWGITAEDISARIIGRELDEDEINTLGLDLEYLAGETFCDSCPVTPVKGTFLKDAYGNRWTVVDSAGHVDRAEGIMLLERWDFHGKIKRAFPTSYLHDHVEIDGVSVPMLMPMYAEVADHPVKEEELDSGTSGATLWA